MCGEGCVCADIRFICGSLYSPERSICCSACSRRFHFMILVRLSKPSATSVSVLSPPSLSLFIHTHPFGLFTVSPLIYRENWRTHVIL